jgi:uncharacterized membrane protein YhaH (DUF805 family)
MRRSRWFWVAIVVVVGVIDVVVLQATGNGNSGKNDGAGQIIGFWIFVLCVLALVTLAVVTGISRWRKRRAA